MRVNKILKFGFLIFIVAIMIVTPLSVGFVNASPATGAVKLGSGFTDILSSSNAVDGAAGLLTGLGFSIMRVGLWVLKIIAAFLLGIAGQLLDFSIKFTTDTANFTQVKAIDIGWKVVRDLVNMTFIFAILYIAISTILGTGGAANRRVLARLVIAALLINFSKFIAGVVIDAANIVALTFNNAIQGGSALSVLIVDKLEILSFFKFSLLSATSQALVVIQEFTIFIIIFISMLAFMFAAMLFVGRTIMLMFALISAPIGYIGMILPSLSEYSKKWWHNLFNQSLVAPVFLFFMFILIKIINNLALSIQKTTSGETSVIAVYFNFAIIIGFIIVAVKTTKNLSGQIATIATTVAGLAGGAALGGTALLARGTLGRGAGMLARSKAGKGLQSVGRNDDGSAVRGFGGWAKRLGGKAGMATLRASQSSTFDVRQTRGGKSAFGSIKGQTGIDVGGYKAKGGFSGAVDRKEKAKKKKAKSYENAGFEDEAKRIKESPGVIASTTASVFPEAFANSPFFRSFFKGQIPIDRLQLKMEKRAKERVAIIDARTKKKDQENKIEDLRVQRSKYSLDERGYRAITELIEEEKKTLKDLAATLLEVEDKKAERIRNESSSKKEKDDDKKDDDKK